MPVRGANLHSVEQPKGLGNGYGRNEQLTGGMPPHLSLWGAVLVATNEHHFQSPRGWNRLPDGTCTDPGQCEGKGAASGLGKTRSVEVGGGLTHPTPQLGGCWEEACGR